MKITVKPSSRLLSAFNSAVWAITEEKFATMREVLEAHACGIEMSAEEFAEMRAAQPQASPPRMVKSVQVIPVVGVMAQRMNIMSALSGGVSTEMLRKQIVSAVNDPAVDAIVLDVDSPGGNFAGSPELAETIRDLRDTKPIVAVANSLMASAAYLISSGATEIVAAPGSDVGSIGCFVLHEDESGFAEMNGVKQTLVRSAPLKAVANSWEPLSDEAKQILQTRVDNAHAMFVNAVAKGRGVKPSVVDSTYGQGDIVAAKDALAAGMIDRIATLDETIQRLSAGRTPKKSGPTRAELMDLHSLEL